MEHARRFNEQLGLECRDKAIEELTAKGVTFPVGIDYYIIMIMVTVSKRVQSLSQ